jgi:hypothetical protein
LFIVFVKFSCYIVTIFSISIVDFGTYLRIDINSRHHSISFCREVTKLVMLIRINIHQCGCGHFGATVLGGGGGGLLVGNWDK